jgi:hypothetical protein
MFRKRDPQHDLFASSMLVPSEKAERLRRSWAEPFRTKALPLIDEERFAPMYHPDNGRPNAPVQVVLGVLILKDMFDLTDEETVAQLEFNLQWHHALRLTPDGAHLCEKTLHNFRVRLMEQKLGRLAFVETTDRIIKTLGIRTGRQRLDSTHILSNIAILTRLGLFSETTRVFLSALYSAHPRLYTQVPEGLRGRYLKDDGSATAYADARSEKARRRLPVCARDLYRLVDLFRGTAAAKLESYALMERLLAEQCEVVGRDERPLKDDDDDGEGGVPVVVKEPKDVSANSLQSPHDPEVTYSGHKGKGYEVQVSETCHPENPVEIITHVEVTPSCKSDERATVPTIEALAERDIQPDELVADTSYGSAKNCVAAERLGTEVVSPVGGSAPAEVPHEATTPLAPEDFRVDTAYRVPTVCPAGRSSVAEIEYTDQPGCIAATFERATCESCPDYARCPAWENAKGTGYTMDLDLERANLARRRQAQASGAFAPRYAIRAGSEATNSELKRRHGMGKLRVRRKPRVELAVYLKALACNLKRMVRALMVEEAAMAPARA